ncbi:hypothetical protein BASA60_001140 [Batrachochytrium salamandrivorans]|nr:hypothetical protein BASA60_001140 [Batrachochytrium salamandrivorans]
MRHLLLLMETRVGQTLLTPSMHQQQQQQHRYSYYKRSVFRDKFRPLVSPLSFPVTRHQTSLFCAANVVRVVCVELSFNSMQSDEAHNPFLEGLTIPITGTTTTGTTIPTTGTNGTTTGTTTIGTTGTTGTTIPTTGTNGTTGTTNTTNSKGCTSILHLQSSLSAYTRPSFLSLLNGSSSLVQLQSQLQDGYDEHDEHKEYDEHDKHKEYDEHDDYKHHQQRQKQQEEQLQHRLQQHLLTGFTPSDRFISTISESSRLLFQLHTNGIQGSSASAPMTPTTTTTTTAATIPDTTIGTTTPDTIPNTTIPDTTTPNTTTTTDTITDNNVPQSPTLAVDNRMPLADNLHPLMRTPQRHRQRRHMDWDLATRAVDFLQTPASPFRVGVDQTAAHTMRSPSPIDRLSPLPVAMDEAFTPAAGQRRVYLTPSSATSSGSFSFHSHPPEKRQRLLDAEELARLSASVYIGQLKHVMGIPLLPEPLLQHTSDIAVHACPSIRSKAPEPSPFDHEPQTTPSPLLASDKFNLHSQVPFDRHLIMKTPTKRSGSSTLRHSPHSVDAHSIFSPLMSPFKGSNQRRRRLPISPERVLDAPGVLDDYYIDVLSWSALGLLMVGLNDKCYLWNQAEGAVNEIYQACLPDYISCCTFSPRGHQSAVGTASGELLLFDVRRIPASSQQADPLQSYKHTSGVNALRWIDHSSYIIGDSLGDLYVRDIRCPGGLPVLQAQGFHLDRVVGIAVHWNEQSIATGGNGQLVNLWDIRKLNRPTSVLKHHQSAVRALQWCPWEHSILATGGGLHDGKLCIVNTDDGTCISTIETGAQVCQMVWSRQYRELISLHDLEKDQMVLWKYPSMEQIGMLPGHTGARPLYVALSPDGQTVATMAGDETIKFWKCFPTLSSQRPLRPPRTGIESLEPPRTIR